MIGAIRQAFLTTEVDERRMTALLAGANPWCGMSALGILVHEVVTVILRDRSLIRRWLSEARETAT